MKIFVPWVVRWGGFLNYERLMKESLHGVNLFECETAVLWRWP